MTGVDRKDVEHALDVLGVRRGRAMRAAEEAHRKALAAAAHFVAEGAVSVSVAAELMGVTRPTIYAELRKQAALAEREAASASSTPGPGPHDTDREGDR